ncbi:MAG: hypothetical protein DI537_40855 [Stutzerimonas stutzeri]|nr:MAG: hypothetical protein DI537_40855 [Stutzerimonas stutzeri]
MIGLVSIGVGWLVLGARRVIRPVRLHRDPVGEALQKIVPLLQPPHLSREAVNPIELSFESPQQEREPTRVVWERGADLPRTRMSAPVQ